MANELFEILFKLGIKKNKKIYMNLCNFLCLDKNYNEYLVVNKLKRCVDDFEKLDYFKSFETKK